MGIGPYDESLNYRNSLALHFQKPLVLFDVCIESVHVCLLGCKGRTLGIGENMSIQIFFKGFFWQPFSAFCWLY